MAKINVKSKVTRKSPVIDTDLMSDADKERFDNLPEDQQAQKVGFGRSNKQDFDVPSYTKAKVEKVYSHGGSSIVFGKDRPSNIFSGFGGDQATHSAALDLVVGRFGYLGKAKTKNGQPISADPNFKTDAARIYMSQKSDPDGYFGIARAGYSTSRKDPRSTIVMKADTVRLVSRENIKIVTRTDAVNAQGAQLSNAYVGNYGISLIALNDEKSLQPMVKGDNLKQCLKGIIEGMQEIIGLLDNFVEYDRNLTTALLTHTHNSPFLGIPTSPSFGLLPDGIKSMLDKILNVQLQTTPSLTQKINSIQMNYLENTGGTTATKDDQSLYILSRYNKNN